MPRKVAEAIYKQRIFNDSWSIVPVRRRKVEKFGRPRFYTEEQLSAKCENVFSISRPEVVCRPLAIYSRALAYQRNKYFDVFARELRESEERHGIAYAFKTARFLAAREVFKLSQRDSFSSRKYNESIRLVKDGQ